MEDVVTSEVIGGKDVIVEISLIKLNYEYTTLENWVLAGIERKSGKSFAVFLQEIDNMDRGVIEPLIVEHIRPGSVIMSECLPFYDNVENLVDRKGNHLNYKHHSFYPGTRSCY